MLYIADNVCFSRDLQSGKANAFVRSQIWKCDLKSEDKTRKNVHVINYALHFHRHSSVLVVLDSRKTLAGILFYQLSDGKQ